jgi:hypothetical protein
MLEATLKFLEGHPDFYLTLIGATVGAIVSGLISLFLQGWIFRKENQRRISDRLSIEQAHCHSLYIKMSRIYSNIWMLNDHLKISLGRLGAQDNPIFKFLAVQPLATHLAPLSFSTEELLLMRQKNELELFNDLLDVESVHNNLIGLFDEYRTMREGVISVLPHNYDIANMTAIVAPADLAPIMPKVLAINFLVGDMVKHCVKEEEFSKTILEQLNIALGKHYSIQQRIKFKNEVI